MKIIKTSEDTIENVYVSCPFCKETDFDLMGLKGHLEHGDCEIYNTIDISQMQRLMDNF